MEVVPSLFCTRTADKREGKRVENRQNALLRENFSQTIKKRHKALPFMGGGKYPLEEAQIYSTATTLVRPVATGQASTSQSAQPQTVGVSVH